jgi:hypothetical protein
MRREEPRGAKMLALVAAIGSIDTLRQYMRSASLGPYKSSTSPNRPWCVDVPPTLSDTGKRKRKFFETKKLAEAECEKLEARRDNFGVSLNAMTPSRIAEAAEAYKLLEGTSATLLDAVHGFLAVQKARQTPASASSISGTNFSKQRRTATSSTNESYGLLATASLSFTIGSFPTSPLWT